MVVPQQQQTIRLCWDGLDMEKYITHLWHLNKPWPNIKWEYWGMGLVLSKLSSTPMGSPSLL